MYHNVVRKDERDGLKNTWIGQSAAKHLTEVKVQRLSLRGVPGERLGSGRHRRR